MKIFSKAEIDGAIKHFRSQKFQEVEVSLNGNRFSYFVLPQTLEPNLLNFVHRRTGANPDEYVFGVSDNTNEKYRQYVAFHEFFEFTKIGISVPDRCVMSLKEELLLVPGDIKVDYVKMRRNFFKDLIAYCSNQPANYTDSDLNEFRKSLVELERLV